MTVNNVHIAHMCCCWWGPHRKSISLQAGMTIFDTGISSTVFSLLLYPPRRRDKCGNMNEIWYVDWNWQCSSLSCAGCVCGSPQRAKQTPACSPSSSLSHFISFPFSTAWLVFCSVVCQMITWILQILSRKVQVNTLALIPHLCQWAHMGPWAQAWRAGLLSAPTCV